MSDRQAVGAGAEEVKTCPGCGGTWPADRPVCPACGVGLGGIAARPAGEAAGEQAVDWRWLDALASEEESPATSEGQEPKRERAKRAWWQFWR
jgi:hypothetical protein